MTTKVERLLSVLSIKLLKGSEVDCLHIELTSLGHQKAEENEEYNMIF